MEPPMNKYEAKFRGLLELSDPPASPGKATSWLASWRSPSQPSQDLAAKLNEWYIAFSTTFFDVQLKKDHQGLEALKDLAKRIAPKLKPFEKIDEYKGITSAYHTLLATVRSTQLVSGDTLRKTNSSNAVHETSSPFRRNVEANVSPRLLVSVSSTYSSLLVEREKSKSDEEQSELKKEREVYQQKVAAFLDGAHQKSAYSFFTNLLSVENPKKLKVWGSLLSGIQVAGLVQMALEAGQEKLRSKLIYLIGALKPFEFSGFFASLGENIPFLQEILLEPCKVVYINDIPHIFYAGPNPPQGECIDETAGVRHWFRQSTHALFKHLEQTRAEVFEEIEALKKTITPQLLEQCPVDIEKAVLKVENKIENAIRLLNDCRDLFCNSELTNKTFMEGAKVLRLKNQFLEFQQELVYSPVEGIWKALNEFIKDYEGDTRGNYYLEAYPLDLLTIFNIATPDEMEEAGLLANISSDHNSSLKKLGESKSSILFDQAKINLEVMGLRSREDFKRHKIYSRNTFVKFCAANLEKLKAQPFHTDPQGRLVDFKVLTLHQFKQIGLLCNVKAPDSTPEQLFSLAYENLLVLGLGSREDFSREGITSQRDLHHFIQSNRGKLIEVQV